MPCLRLLICSFCITTDVSFKMNKSSLFVTNLILTDKTIYEIENFLCFEVFNYVL